MLACRTRPHRLAALSFLSVPPPRAAFTSPSTPTSPSEAIAPTSQSTGTSADSIFSAPESPWDHVFSDIELPPPQRPRTRFTANAGAGPILSGRKHHGQSKTQTDNPASPLVQRASGVRRQRASITAREMSVFDEMFDLIFNAVSGKDGKASPSSSSTRTSPNAPSSSPSFAGQTPSIGRTGDAPLNDLFRTLRRQSRVRWTTAIDEELDRKKETMELFNTDHELLQWVTLELFEEAQRWDEEAKQAVASSRTKGGSSVEGSATSSTPKERTINHSIYPHLIAHAMRIFRTTYSNPSLSLAIFNHAARVSIPSYVFGCTAPAYNELIEAKWEGWGDLEGVCNALEEMRANGVKIDGRTRIVVERVRKELGEARPVALGEAKHEAEANRDVNPLVRRVWGALGETEVMRLLHRIERLALRERTRKSTTSPHEETWKSAVLEPVDDGWSFDGWEKEKKDARKRVRTTKSTSEGADDASEEKLAFR